MIVVAFGAEAAAAAAAIRAQQQKAAQAQALRNAQLLIDSQNVAQKRQASVASESVTGHAIVYSPKYGTTVVGKRTL